MTKRIEPFECEYCSEHVADQPDGAVDFGGTSFCSRDCATEYGKDCGRPIHPESLDDVWVLPERPQ